MTSGKHRRKEMKLKQPMYVLNYKQKDQDNEKLGLNIVKYFSPRGSKGKVLKIKKNRSTMRCGRDC